MKKRTKRARGRLPVMSTELYELALATIEPPEDVPGTPRSDDEAAVLDELTAMVAANQVDLAEIEPIDHRIVCT